MKILKLYRIINMSCWDYFHVYTFQRSPFWLKKDNSFIKYPFSGVLEDTKISTKILIDMSKFKKDILFSMFLNSTNQEHSSIAQSYNFKEMKILQCLSYEFKS